MKKLILLFCLFVAVLGFVKFAVADGVKVDDDANCSDVDREQNQLSSGGTATIWVNNSGINNFATYQYVITCNTKPQSCTGCLSDTFTRCTANSGTSISEENYLFVDNPILLTGAQGKCTIQVFEDGTCTNKSTSGNPCNFGGTNVGSDSWIQN